MNRLAEAVKRIRSSTEKNGTVFEIWRPEPDQDFANSPEAHFAFEDFDVLKEEAESLLNNDWRLVMAVPTNETDLIINKKKIYFLFTIEPGSNVNESFSEAQSSQKNTVSNSCFTGSFVVFEWMAEDEKLTWVIDKLKDFDHKRQNNVTINSTREDKPENYLQDIKFLKQLFPYFHEINLYFNYSTSDGKPLPYPEFKRENHEGEFIPVYSRVIVGPVHAGVIPPGRFTFDLVGERVHQAAIDLGYTHKGTEAIFEKLADQERPEMSWKQGLKVAGAVAGDMAAAHECAYCRAVEALAGVYPTQTTNWLRAILIELERIVNHLNDVGTIARGVAFEKPATHIWMIREELRELFFEWTGSRLLRGCLRLGGIGDSAQEKLFNVWSKGFPDRLSEILKAFYDPIRLSSDPKKEPDDLIHALWKHPGVRDRIKDLGVLKRQDAISLGAVGPVARSAGSERDFRKQHPWGPYRDSKIQDILHEDRDEFYDEKNGDAMSRLAIRLHEITISLRLLHEWSAEKARFTDNAKEKQEEEVLEGIQQAPAYIYRLGYCEGWRGEVIYWVMKGEDHGIFRVKVRDPSTINWRVMEHTLNSQSERPRMGIACFPLINKSFNLSYSGNDL